MIRILQKDNRIMKYVLALVIGAAVISMVAYLIPGFMDSPTASGATDTYATVHSPGFWGRFETPSTVKNAEVEQIAHRMLQQQRLPDFLLSYMMTRAGTVLVQQQVLLREADKLGLQVSDADLRHEFQFGPSAQVLFPDGKYIGDDAYITFVQNQFNMSRTDFEQRVKEELEVSRLEDMVTGGVSASDNEVRDYYRTQGTKVKFVYATIASDDISKSINPSDSDLQAFFSQNKSRYATAVPESRKIAYIAFDAASFPGGKPSVSSGELQQYYNAHQDQYAVKDEVRVRHILIAVPSGANAATDAAAKAKAQGVLKQIKAGGNFADLAKKNSDDPGSKVAGGELGFLAHGATVPEFDKTAFSLGVGQTSDVIKTQFGYHILQVEEKHAAHQKPLNDVKDEILPIIQQQKAGAAEEQFATQLAAEAKKNGLDKAAAAHGLHVVTTDYVAQTGIIPGLSDASTLLTQAFSAKQGDAPASVSIGDGFAVFQVTDIKSAHAPDFASFKAHVLDDYRQQKTPQLLASKLNTLAARAKALGDLTKAAKEQKVDVKTSDLVDKSGQVPGIGSMSGQAGVAFTLAKGQISQPINTGSTGILLSVIDKQEPTPDEIAQHFDKTKEQMLQQKRDELFGVFAGTLMDKYEKAGAIKYSKKAPTTPSPFGN
jgi:peptidyl-prolyl cis-trans isomerase D